MRLKYLTLIGFVPLLVGTSCVSKKAFRAEAAKLENLQNIHTSLQTDLRNCETNKNAANQKISKLEADNSALEGRIKDLLNQIDFLKDNNNVVIKQLSDLSVISSSQAESIKKSLDNIGAKDMYIQDLQSAIARKDSLNMALVMNLKGAIGDLNDSDIEIKVDKSAVYVSISDKLLFKTGSYEVTDKAMGVLAKVAKVLQNQPEIEFIVEGHTDNVPIKGGPIKDNWDLSVLRATSVVRILQNNFGLQPKRMTAGGRSEYVPVADNTTVEGRSKNRRTRIVILPQLDQFFKLLETK
ncbi:MAG: OmpA family protein [Chitinophagales bacterium]|nr:OmpA family protein [Chitinophagales bacterium]MCZ2394377.1 OmpA family protein [Chitinophagales bacterium]